MSSERRFSRPFAAASDLLDAEPDEVERLFRRAHVLVRLEEALADSADARATLLLAVNEILRFCPNVAVDVPRRQAALLEACDRLAKAIHGAGACVSRLPAPTLDSFDAVLNVGLEIRPGWITASSNGWLARVARRRSAWVPMPHPDAVPNPLGALAAACLGAGEVFSILLGHDDAPNPYEVSLFDYRSGPIGTFNPGPPLPTALALVTLLVGCGAVSNAWAYTVKQLPISGAAEAVDRQSLGEENIGPYVLARIDDLGRPKAEIVRETLQPALTVTPRPEEFHFFKARLRYGQTTLPELLVAGVDNVETRHDIQRLWPSVVIDMAAGGLTSQVIVKHLADAGQCLLDAHTLPPDETAVVERLARMSGLRPERIANEFEQPVSADDVAQAAPAFRASLEKARQAGQPRCGYVSDLNLADQWRHERFASAVPFVTAFSGIVAAGEAVKHLAGWSSGSLQFQFSFQSGRGRRTTRRCTDACECQHVRASRAA